jgi:DNA repair protein RadC
MPLAQSLTHTRYKLTGETTEQDVLAAAEGILRNKLERQGSIGSPTDANDFLRMRLGALLHEEFHVLWLDNRHGLYPDNADTSKKVKDRQSVASSKRSPAAIG